MKIDIERFLKMIIFGPNTFLKMEEEDKRLEEECQKNREIFRCQMEKLENQRKELDRLDEIRENLLESSKRLNLRPSRQTF